MIKAVIFDLDGVLIDSENFMINIYRKFIKECNLDLKIEDFYIMVGSNRKMNLIQKIYQQSHMGWSEEYFRQNLEAIKKRERADLTFDKIMFKEVPSVIKELHRLGYRLILASSSHIDYIHRALNECGIAQYFDIVVSGLDFKESKPNPEIYNHCVKRLGFKKDECVVVEDSEYGIEAGKRADLYVYARKDKDFGMNQSKADYMINDLNDLLDHLNSIN